MKIALWILTMLGSLLQLSAAVAAPAVTSEQPTVKLALFKVVSVAGKDQWQSASSVAPGHVVEYQAIYLNPTTKSMKDVQVTLPVPKGGLEVMPAWKGAVPALASTDGKRFEAMPLMSTETLSDGTQVKRPVPVADYRFLRWTLGEVSAGGTRTVSARMQLPALSTSVANASPSTSAQPSAR